MNESRGATLVAYITHNEIYGDRIFKRVNDYLFGQKRGGVRAYDVTVLDDVCWDIYTHWFKILDD